MMKTIAILMFAMAACAADGPETANTSQPIVCVMCGPEAIDDAEIDATWGNAFAYGFVPDGCSAGNGTRAGERVASCYLLTADGSAVAENCYTRYDAGGHVLGSGCQTY